MVQWLKFGIAVGDIHMAWVMAEARDRFIMVAASLAEDRASQKGKVGGAVETGC
jgi:hypothetical protein